MKRLDIDDVKNSEYIEEDEIKKYSFEQKSQLFKNSNIIMSTHGQEDILFKFQMNGGGTGGLEYQLRNTQLNRSQDPLDETRRVSSGNEDYSKKQNTK